MVGLSKQGHNAAGGVARQQRANGCYWAVLMALGLGLTGVPLRAQPTTLAASTQAATAPGQLSAKREEKLRQVESLAALVGKPEIKQQIEGSVIWLKVSAGKLDRAEVERGLDPTQKAALLCTRAEGQLKTKQPTARATLAEAHKQILALPLALPPKDSRERWAKEAAIRSLAMKLAEIYSTADMFTEAEQMYALGTDVNTALRWGQEQRYTRAVERKDFAGARMMVAEIKDPTVRDSKMWRLGLAAEAAGDKPNALAAYEQRLHVGMYGVEFVDSPILKLVRLGRSDLVVAGADKMTTAIMTGSGTPVNLEPLVKEILAYGTVEQAVALLNKCVSVMPQPTKTDMATIVILPNYKTWVHIALLQQLCKDTAGAKRSLGQAAEHLNAFTPSGADGIQQVFHAYARLAGIYYTLGAKAEYQATVAKLEADAEAKKNKVRYYEALAGLTYELANVDDLVGALRLYKLLTEEEVLLACNPEGYSGYAMGWVVPLAVFRAHWRAGDKTAAETAFTQATAMLGKCKLLEQQNGLTKLVQARLDVGDRDGAMHIIASTKLRVTGDIARSVAQAYAQNDEMPKAIQAIKLMQEEYLTAHNGVLEAVADIRFKRGDTAGALALLSKNPWRTYEDSKLSKLLLGLAKDGDVDTVMKYLESPSLGLIRKLAGVRVEANDPAGAIRILERGIEAGLVQHKPSPHEIWPMIELLAVLDPQKAVTIAELYHPQEPARAGENDKQTQVARIMRMKIWAGQFDDVLKQLASQPASEVRDRLILSVYSSVLVPPSNTFKEPARRPEY
jgi:tetratricopeptide (TPR) repeat protein